MIFDSRNISIAFGLIVPDDQSHKVFECCKETRPGLHEMELASREHRLKPIRDLQKDLFNAFMEEVTENEIDGLRILGLPDINTVRLDYEQKGVDDQFILNNNALREFEGIFKDWSVDLIDGNQTVYPHHMMRGYQIGLDTTLQEIIKDAPDEVANSLERNAVFASFDDEYLKAVIKSGTSRIKVELTKDSLMKTRAALKEMAKGEKTVMEVARWLHKNTFEGKAWYWNRLARSEAVLATEAAYERQSNAQGVRFDRWSAAPTACPICSAFHGRVWKRGDGPMPVEDTHPHCLCRRIPKFYHDGIIQRRWDRPTPYDRPYTREELERLPLRFAA